MRSRAHVRDEPLVGGMRLYLLELGGGREEEKVASVQGGLSIWQWKKNYFPFIFLTSYTVKCHLMWGWRMWGRGKRCGRMEKVLNSCLVIWESEFSREMECDHKVTLHVRIVVVNLT